MNSNRQKPRSLRSFFLLLLALSAPLWIFGSIYNVQIFEGLYLFQLPLAMPMVTALILIYRENGKAGIVSLLKRTYDFHKIKSKAWYLPILLLYPSFGFINYWIQRWSGASIPSPHFSLEIFLGYCTVFFMTYGEELGLTGYATEPMQQRYSALTSGILLGLVWAGYHILGFIISGYFSFEWILWHTLFTVAGRVLFIWIYNNSGKSLGSMALLHWSTGLFWSLWPQDNLQKAVPFYDPFICALIAISCVAIVTLLWGSKTLAKFKYARVSHTISEN